MNKILFTLLTVFVLSLSALGQLGKPSLSLATMQDLRNRQPVDNEIVEVRHGGVSNLWNAPRIFTHYPLSTEPADDIFVVTNKSNKGRYAATDRNGPFYDVAWFGIDPSLDDNAAGWASVGSHAYRLRWNIGRYRFSNTINLTNALPVRWLAEAGSYQGGWISTNQVQEAELIYVGPPTNTFVNMVTGKDNSGNQMLRYGHSMENVSFQANGLAQTALAIGHIGRLDMTAVRYNGATDTNMFLGQLQFGRFEDCSTSINDETPKPTVRARIGLAIEGFSPVNTFNNCVWENSSEYAIVFGVNAKNNTIIGGAVESNDGNGVYYGNGVTANTMIGTWFEANKGGTNIMIAPGAYWNTFIGVRMTEDSLCTLSVYSGYNTFIDCQLYNVYIDPSGTRNKWINCVYSGTFTDLSRGGQTYLDLIDPTATIRTNTFSSPFVMYGDYFKLWLNTNLYERAKLTYDSIEFGDGSNPTDSKIQRISANTLQTPNEIRAFRASATDVAFSTVLSGDAFTRMTIDSQGIFFGPGSTARDTWWKRNGISNWITEAQTWFVQQTTNGVALAVVRPGNAVLPFTLRGDGQLAWGDGATARDVSIERTAPGVLTLNGGLALTEHAEPAVPQSTTATVWLEEADTSKSIKVKWPDGSNTALYPQAGGSGITNTVEVLVFTNSGIYVKPSNVKLIRVIAIGGGGGGGSGRRGTNSPAAQGGSGGSGGAMAEGFFSPSEVGTNETVTVGSGGGGAPGILTDSTDGISGTNGTGSYFGSLVWGVAGPGGPGGLGTGSAANSTVNASMWNSGPGGAGGGGSAANTPTTVQNRPGGAGGGGGGGGISTAGVTNHASRGGHVYNANAYFGGDGGTVAGVNGTNGVSNTGIARPGTGGGGGTPGFSTIGNGGSGGWPGGGGGGGAGCKNGVTSGAGGNGAKGAVWVFNYY